MNLHIGDNNIVQTVSVGDFDLTNSMNLTLIIFKK